MAFLRTYAALAGVVATTVACGGGTPPELSPLGDQEVAVGTELVIPLVGTDSDGDDLDYQFHADVPDIYQRASITKRPDGTGLFRWTPKAADVGPWFFDFSVSDGDGKDTLTITVEVKSAVGVNSAPVFREPLGTGTTLDLAQKSCIDLGVVVEDQDSSSVVIAQEEPIIAGATLTSTGGLSASWHWCPTPTDIAADDRYTLVLSADDLTNPKTMKHYLIVLRKPPKPDCPGDAPVVDHTPSDVSSLVGLTIDAQISDDMGLKAAPLLYYSTTQPADPPDLGAMTQTSMLLISGSMQNGSWAADVPNPVAGGSAGSQATLYYVIVAQDDDDATGDCDHLTQAPITGTYSMVVTNPGGSGGAGVCEACTADVQCGGANDLCVRVGTAGDSYCLSTCSSSADCPTDYSCSPSAVTSVNGGSGRQCVPDSNDCTNPGGTTCVDDAYEENDSRSAAALNPSLAPGTYNLTSCPGVAPDDDEDWFAIDVSSDAQVTVNLSGTSVTDLDLGLYDDTGTSIQRSTSLTSTESVSQCLSMGTYYIRVNAYGTGSNDYSLTYTQASMSCAPTCADDDLEPDDDAAHARPLSFTDIDVGSNGPYVSETNAICAYNEDWYGMTLVDGDKLTVDVLFTMASSAEDLDVKIVDAGGTRQTSGQGQSVTDDEHLDFTVNDAACTISSQCPYYVVVYGYNGAENLYDISIGLEIGP